MKPRPNRLLLALCALLALTALPPAARAAPAHTGSLLYVQQVEGGKLVHLGPGDFELRLTGVSPRVSTFTDRPRRRAGSERLASFVGGWGREGFAADPPNAALVLDRGPRSRDVALLTLSRPHYDRGPETLSYRVAPLHEKDAGALDSFARRADRVRAGDFGAASLFIDDGGGAVIPVDIDVTSAEPGQTLSFRAQPFEGGRADWTFQRPSGNGLQLFASPGLPLSSFLVSGETVSLGILPEGSASINFSLTIWLELEGTEAFYLSASGEPAATITATFPTATGPETQILSEAPALLRPGF